MKSLQGLDATVRRCMSCQVLHGVGHRAYLTCPWVLRVKATVMLALVTIPSGLTVPKGPDVSLIPLRVSVRDKLLLRRLQNLKQFTLYVSSAFS